MAVLRAGATNSTSAVSCSVQEFIGAAAELVDLSTIGVGAMSTYWAWDTKAGFVFDGTNWQPLA